MRKQTGLHILVGVSAGALATVLLLAGINSGVLPNPTTTPGEVSQNNNDNPRAITSTTGSAGKIYASDDDPQFPHSTEIRHELVLEKAKKSKINSRGVMADVITINDKEYPLRTYRSLMTVNDPQGAQWWTTAANIDRAWDFGAANQKVTLAIIDTGFSLTHEEFANRWHRNDGEYGAASIEATSRLNCTDRGLAVNQSCNLVDDDVDGVVDNESGTIPYENPSQRNCTDQGIPLDKFCNRIDDDANGYIDDGQGWDVINQDKSVQAGQLSPFGDGTRHGTMVAGVAAATGNNAVGIAGVNWNATILPIQALDDDGYGNTRSVGESIYYAINQKADVINISLGTDFEDYYVREAVEAATAAGITIVASSGNDGCDCIVYPARHPEVIAVGATSATGGLTSFSSWGTALDIVAPGVGYTLPTWSEANPTAAYASDVAGTSFSSPLVAGLVSHLKAHQPKSNPLQLIGALHETTNRSRLSSSEVRNNTYGYGTVDAFAARERLVTPRHAEIAYELSRISTGNYLSTSRPTELTGRYIVKDCQLQRSNLPLYELIGNPRPFFSISEVEARVAEETQGFTRRTFANVCIGQVHDTYGVLRSINVYSEFKNIVLKP